MSALPPRLQERVLRYLVRAAAGQAADYGLPMPTSRNLNRNLPVINTLLPYWIHHGRIRVRPGIQSISGTEVCFADGTRECFESIVWATGFQVSLPFLDNGLLKWQNGVPERVAAAMLSETVARLYFIGLTAPRGPQLPAYSQQAELLVRLLSLQEQRSGPLAPGSRFLAVRAASSTSSGTSGRPMCERRGNC